MVDLAELSRSPIVVAPLSGGPSTPDLVIASAEAGAIGFLAAGYKSAADMNAEIATVRAGCAAAFGVNLFVPQPSTAESTALAAYLETLAPDAARLGAAVGTAVWEDDDWEPKIASLLADPPVLVSFTFGCPPLEIVAAFHDRDTVVIVTVTNADDALRAAAVGADLVVAQGFEAGGHRATFTNDDRDGQDIGLLALIADISRVTDTPVIAAGGIVGPRGVAAVLAAGAVAAQLGTAFLRCPESGTSPAYRDALVDPRFTTTAITRAFTGRRARGLVNQFMLDHPAAPPAYPEIHKATRPLRSAAVAAGDPEHVNLWAGQGFRSATDRSAGEIIEWLAGNE